MSDLSQLSDSQLLALYRANQPAAPEVGTAEDVARAVPSGLVKGAATMLGMPGDIRDALGALRDYLVRTEGMSGKQADAVTSVLTSAARALPGGFALENVLKAGMTSGQARAAIEGITGPLYEPKTRAGRFAQTAAEFVPATAIAPARGLAQVGVNAIRYGVLPGLASEAAGQATEGTGLEPWARAGAAIGTGAAAGLAARPSSAAQAIRDKLPQYVTEAHIGEAQALIADAAGRGVTLTWPEALSQVTKRPVLTDMQRVVESAPRTRTAMQEFYNDRPQQVSSAVGQELDNIAPSRPDPSMIGREAGEAARGSLHDVRTAINTATDPLYAAAANTRIPAAEMARVRALPGYAEARLAVANNPQLARYVAGLPENSVGFQNEIKKFLDQRGSNAASRFNPEANQQVAAGYTSDAAAVRQAGVNASPEYERALEMQAQLRQQFLEPLMVGPLGRMARKDTTTRNAIEALFPSQPLPGSQQEVATAVSALAARNPAVARDLVRAHLEAKLNEAFYAAGRGNEAPQFAGATFAARAAGSPVVDTQRYENLRAAVEALPNGQRTWVGFERLLEVMRATGTRQPQNSKTAWNLREEQQLSSGGAAAGAVKLGASPGKWLTVASDRVSAWQLGRNLDQIASILTDPNAARLLQRLAQMPAGSTQAAAAATRIIVQTSTDARSRAAQPRNEVEQ